MITPQQFLEAQPRDTLIIDQRQDEWAIESVEHADSGTILYALDPEDHQRRLSMNAAGKIIDCETLRVIPELNASNTLMFG